MGGESTGDFEGFFLLSIFAMSGSWMNPVNKSSGNHRRGCITPESFRGYTGGFYKPGIERIFQPPPLSRQFAHAG